MEQRIKTILTYICIVIIMFVIIRFIYLTQNYKESFYTDTSSQKCPEIDTLLSQQSTVQQICDSLEYQDKTKSEKLRTERNKQYLLKLQNQQKEIDQLNTVIQTLDNQRQSRAEVSDQVRLLQYKKQQGDANNIIALANQRLDSQANNQLYFDVNIKKNSKIIQ